ncbi:MAG: helix-turn-helix domain-containing protein, partial [Rhizobacter sp.]|nr:helix-turn-helix domain-containing protein [Rhizobacter sp.]
MMLGMDAQGFPLWQGALLDLPPKERAVLALLIRRAPGVVSKQAFADEAWQGRPMSDESLARCISRVRRALLAWDLKVESVYGLGYQLLEPSPADTQSGGPGKSALDTLTHARQLLQQRTPAAVGRAIEL